jgi:hypothetical protein
MVLSNSPSTTHTAPSKPGYQLGKSKPKATASAKATAAPMDQAAAP